MQQDRGNVGFAVDSVGRSRSYRVEIAKVTRRARGGRKFTRRGPRISRRTVTKRDFIDHAQWFINPPEVRTPLSLSLSSGIIYPDSVPSIVLSADPRLFTRRYFRLDIYWVIEAGRNSILENFSTRSIDSIFYKFF